MPYWMYRAYQIYNNYLGDSFEDVVNNNNTTLMKSQNRLGRLIIATIAEFFTCTSVKQALYQIFRARWKSIGQIDYIFENR